MKRGDRAMFDRGMFGWWPCTIVRIYTGRGRFNHGRRLALVRFSRRNGSAGRARVVLGDLRPRAEVLQ